MKYILLINCIIWLAFYAATGIVYANIPTPVSFHLPLTFTENKGQILTEKGEVRTDILFSGTGHGVNFYLTRQGIIYSWNKSHKGKKIWQQVHMELIGTNASVQVGAENQVPGVNNYFHPAYPKGLTQVKSYQRVVYKEIYPNIDFVVYTNGTDLKYDFIVKPGGNPAHIRFSYKGNQQLKLKKNGSLLISNPMGKLIEGIPFTYQQHLSDSSQVPSAYCLQNGIVSFNIGSYDITRPLIIDPAVSWASYYGGENDDIFSIKTDDAGNLYAVGNSRSTSRVTKNGYINTFPAGAGRSGLIFKLDTQQQLLWATYFGTECTVNEIDFDDAGNVFVAGSVDNGGSIPVVNSPNSSPSDGNNIFLAKLSADGVPEWTTYYGGSKDEGARGMIVNNNIIYLTGITNSPDNIATAGSFRSTAFNPNCTSSTNCSYDVFLATFNSAGQQQWGTYYGAENRDEANGMVKDSKSNIIIYGRTAGGISYNSDATQPTFKGGGVDGFIVKFSSDGNLLWGTYFGGSAWDILESLTIDEQDNMYLTGETQSNDLLAGKTGPGPTYKSSWSDDTSPKLEAFIAKLNASGTVQWSTYFGGKRRDSGKVIFYNGKGKLYITGFTNSSTGSEAKSITSGQHLFQFGLNSEHSNTAKEDVFITRFDTLGNKIWGAYYGGTDNESAISLAVAPDGKLYLSGRTESSIAMPSNALYATKGGSFDGFIALIDDKDPLVTALSPVHRAIQVPTDTQLEITFDEPVKKGEGNIIIKQGATISTIPVNDNTVVISGNKVTIDIPDLQPGLSYQIEVEPTVFINQIGNHFGGISAGDWQFISPDNILPEKTVLIPENNASNILFHTNLEINFTEDILAGPGMLTIYRGTTTETIPANHDSVLITGSKVVIKVSDFAFNEKVKVVIDDKAFKDLSGNFFPGIAAENWQFTIQSMEITPLEFMPKSINHTASGLDLANIPSQSIQVTPLLEGTSALLFSRGIGNTFWKKDTIVATGNTYHTTLPMDSIDKIGLEYYFEISPPAGHGTPFRSDTGIVYINYEQGLEIPMNSGSSKNQYQLISIPLELQESSIATVLRFLGEPNIEKWRLYRYNNDGSSAGYEEYITSSEFTGFEPGRAYWILARQGRPFISGAGTTLKVRQAEPYIVNLQPGWNLIGNPYDMEVFWEDVKKANATNAPDLGELYIYNGGNNYDFGELKRYSGGFVWADQLTALKIPVLRNKNARLSAERPLHDKNSAFEVNFTLESKNMQYRFGGLGMHPLASSDKDRYDRYLLPRFADYLEMRFISDLKLAHAFTKQMVPVAEEYTWEFTVETSLASQLTRLTWENYFSEPGGKQLYLYDVQQEIIVNMLEQNSYTFTPASSSQFRVYYGSPVYISKYLRPQRIKLNQNVPNPFRGKTLIPFSLPDGNSEYTVEVSIYNTTGMEVIKLTSNRYQPGFHQLTWNATDKQGNALPAGLYIAKLVVAEEKQTKEMFIRLIIQ